MKFNRHELENKYALVIGLLSSLEEEVVSEEEYLATKDSDINTDEGFNLYFNTIIKPWVMARDKNKREKLVRLLDDLLTNDSLLISDVFDNTFLICNISDNDIFLKRLKKKLTVSGLM